MFLRGRWWGVYQRDQSELWTSLTDGAASE
jgi:hypothetical protein